mmetsp:Transcript_29738/g.79916  ORF Transcript_29738/g.79916 Transcript_29738/m.79916 type:complete len:916 (+) Transcript_29738:81-2828(+)
MGLDLRNVRDDLHDGMTNGFQWWGKFVARNPWKVLLGAVIFLFAFMLGNSQLNPEVRSGFLWSPTQQPAFMHWDYVKETFGEDGHNLVIYARAADGGNIFRKEQLKALLKLHNWTTKKASTPELEGGPTTNPLASMLPFLAPRPTGKDFFWEDVCHRHSPKRDCSSDTNFLRLWDYKEKNIKKDDDDDILDRLTTFHQNVVTVESFSGGLKVDEPDKDVEDQEVESAKGVILSYRLEGTDGYSFEFEAAWNAAIDAEVDTDVIDIAHFSPRSFDDETNKVVFGDMPLFMLGMVIILIYLVLTLGPISSAQNSRVLLGIAVMGNLNLALGAGFGLASLAGVAFPPIAPLLPLIVLGVQLDGIIIIVDYLNHEDPADEIEERVGRSFREAGPAILITTCTTVVAFAVGSQVDLPAVTGFCLFAACAFTMSTVGTFTFFLSLLVLDERRLQNGKSSFAPCCLSSQGLPACAPAPLPRTLKKQHSVFKPEHERHGFIQRFIREKYTPALLHPAVSAGTVIAFIIFVILSILGSPQLELGLPQEDVMPDNSYMLKTFEMEQSVFGGTRVAGDLVIRNEEFKDRSVIQRIDEAIQAIEALDYVVFVPDALNWHEQYDNWLKGRSKPLDNRQTRYTEALDEFLDKFGNDEFRERVACVPGPPPAVEATEWGDECSRPEAVRYFLTWRRPESNEGLDHIRIRTEMESKLEEQGLNGFIHSIAFLVDQVDTVIWELVISNMGFACLSIFVIMLFFSPPLIAVWITICVASIYTDLLGVLYMLDIPLNGVSFVCLVMSVGLSVDYCVHIAHTYEHFYREAGKKGLAARKEAVNAAMTKMGTSVLKGGWTTILGIFVIAFTSSVAFRTFFRILVFTVILGAIHGLILLPILLAYASEPLELCFPPKTPSVETSAVTKPTATAEAKI